ncbi:hypothetical protein [Micromonospora sp. NPDC049799]|uniref:hypothetical protein n=1 Tax=Micromonospora sp. NPDC049799 TaxID=3154741 RepID=UPI0033D0FCF8
MQFVSELRRLSRIKMATEDDVREEFITPLLRLLGYDHARNEIRRAVKLTTPYQSGTKRREYIVPDYVAQSTNGVHLAIDAKSPGTSDEKSVEIVTLPAYVGQVYSYASHREVRAPWFVVSNGHYTAIYEANSDSWQPALLIAQQELPSRFNELLQLVGKSRISMELSKRMEPGWVTQIATVATGFQPMNVEIGDFNADGIAEIAVAISEDRVPIYRINGTLATECATDGWVWWISASGSDEAGSATLIALQKHRGPTDMRGKVIGIGPDVQWEHPLKRPGSGHETLSKIVCDKGRQLVVVADSGASEVLALDFSGQLIWEAALGTGTDPWASVIHLTSLDDETLLVTHAGRDSGRVVKMRLTDGAVIAAAELPFRPTQIELLDYAGHSCAVKASEGSLIGVINLVEMRLTHALELPTESRHGFLAASLSHGVLAAAGISAIKAYNIDALMSGTLDVAWETAEVAGFPMRMEWVAAGEQETLVVCTCGSAAWPSANGLYLLNHEGKVRQRYLLDRNESDTADSLPGFRAFAVRDMNGDGVPAVVAAADDSNLYMWRPNWS